MEIIPFTAIIIAIIVYLIRRATKKERTQSYTSLKERTTFVTCSFPTSPEEDTYVDLERGTYAERRLISTLKRAGISEKAIFHDLYVRKYNNRFSQIDVVAATKVGILVFEVKDYSGWIFGNGRHQQWTQILNYGKEKHRFYNPILQNKKHIDDLKACLRHLGDFPFYSIIVFYGDCELKDINFVPPGTFITTDWRVIDVVDMILSNNKDADYSNKWEIVRILKEFEANGENTEIQNRHIENIRDMLGKERVFD